MRDLMANADFTRIGLAMENLNSNGLQTQFWNSWNSSVREEGGLSEVQIDQAEVVDAWLSAIGRSDLDILEVGCGTGWLCPRLTRFGTVSATDLSDVVLERAQERHPDVRFVAGDFMQMDLGRQNYDAVISLEVLSHVGDQQAFVSKLASLLRPGGTLILATQNRFVLKNFNRIPPPAPGQIRRWVDRHELRRLLDKEFRVEELYSLTPRANHGVMRLLNSRQFNLPIRAVLGRRVDRLKERMWLGWTLMARATKTDSH